MKALSRKRGPCWFLNCSRINLNTSVRSLGDCSPGLWGNVSLVTAVGSCSPGLLAKSSRLKCLKCQAGVRLGSVTNSKQLRAELGTVENRQIFHYLI